MHTTARLQDFYRYPVTSGTIGLAVLVTLGWWSGMNVEPLLINPRAMANGEWWRLLSSTLAHANVIHLLFNLYWMWIFGTIIEKHFGDLPTAGIFVLLAAGSGAAEFALFSGGVGLSGVGFGLFGLLWILGKRHPRFWAVMPPNVVFLFVAWFFFCIVVTVLGIMNFGNVAHASGAGLGVLLGLAIAGKSTKRYLWSAALVAVLAIFFAGATVARHMVNFYFL